MKKVLLTTTALVMTAGVAAAEVSMSGKAQVSAGATGNADMALETHLDLNLSMSMTADNGMTMSTAIGYDSGNMVDGDHYDGDEANTWSTGAAPSLTIGYEGYTITADSTGVADLYNGDKNSGNLGISGSMGDVSFALTGNIGGDNATVAGGSSYSLGYTMGDMTIAIVGSDSADGVINTDAMKATVTYKMGDTTITASSDDKDGVETVTAIGFSTVMDSITVAYTAKNTETAGSSVGDHWDASIAYSAGALTASFALDEADKSTLKAGYDLGGGADLFAVMVNGAAANGSEDFQAIGINFAF